jgi:hypothetical protein
MRILSLSRGATAVRDLHRAPPVRQLQRRGNELHLHSKVLHVQAACYAPSYERLDYGLP